MLGPLVTRALLALFVLAVAASPLTGASPPKITIHGRVVDPAGKPVAEARVLLLPLSSQFEKGRLEVEGRAEPEPVAGISTDTAGAFVLSAPQPGMWRVVVVARGFVPLEHSLIPLTEAVDLPEARLRRDTGITVRLRTPDGRPLKDCRVRVEDGGPSNPRNLWQRIWRIPPRSARTNQEGTVLLPRAESETVRALAGCENRIPSGVDGVRSASVEIGLGEVRSRLLEVRDAAGKPAAGVLVRIGEERWPVGMTSEASRISIPSPGDRGFQPEVFLQTEDGRSLLFRLGPPQPQEQGKPKVVRLPRTGSLDGRVVSAADGGPLTGALVWPGHDPGLFRATGTDGSFRLPASSPGESWIAAGAAGFFQDEVRITVPPDGSLRNPHVRPGAPAVGVGARRGCRRQAVARRDGEDSFPPGHARPESPGPP